MFFFVFSIKMYIILFFIILFYLICYYIYPQSIIIHQTSLEKFSFDLLYNRQPIIIENPIVDIQQIISLWFSYNFLSPFTYDKSILWIKNNHKYLLIKCNENQDLFITNPYTIFNNNVPNTDSNILSLKMKKNQICILPYKWYVLNENFENMSIFGIDDFITYFTIF